MNTYEKYKDSGIEWIGEIPKHWRKYRMANNGLFFKGKGVSKSQLSEEGLPVILYGDIYTKYDIYTERLERNIPLDVAQNSIEIYRGDLLFTASGETIHEIGKGVCYGGSEIAFAGGDVIIFRQSKWNSKYLSYLFNSYLFQEQKSKRSKGDIVVHVYSTQLRNIHFPIPPTKSEQTTIANYLDRKTTQIDQLIADKKRLVELYKEEKTAIINQAVTKGINPDVLMKDSGIEWLGGIPEGWEVKKLKYVAKIQGGFAFSSKYFVPEGIQLIKISNLYQNEFHLERQPTFLPTKFLKTHSNWIVDNGDILMSMTGTLGKKDYGFAVLIKNIKEKYLLNQRVSKIHSVKGVEILYFLHSLRSEYYLNSIFSLPSGTKQGNFSNDDIMNKFIVFPLRTEQTQIVQYIEKESQRIDAKIKKAEKYIELLTEYRTALISEVVTGKVKVV